MASYRSCAKPSLPNRLQRLGKRSCVGILLWGLLWACGLLEGLFLKRGFPIVAFLRSAAEQLPRCTVQDVSQMRLEERQAEFERLARKESDSRRTNEGCASNDKMTISNA